MSMEMDLKKIKAILFDMDGVLIDSEELMASSGIRALAEYGINAKPEDFTPYVGQGEDRYIGCVARSYGKEYELEMKARAYYHYGQHVETEAFVPEEVPGIFTTLKEMGYKIAVCTSADWDKVQHNLRAMHAPREGFDGFVTGDNIENLKPHPEIYLTGAKLVDAAPEECLVVEDSPSGIKAAHAGGMTAVGIDTSFPEEVLMREAQPDFLIHKLSELLELLR